MSRREDIDNAIWSDPDFEELGPDATLLYLWSWTNPRCGMAGIYKVSKRAMTESKVPADKLDDTLAELAAARFAFYETGVLFIRTRVKHLRTHTEQIAKSIRGDLEKVTPEHPMRKLWEEENAACPWLVRYLGDRWHVPNREVHSNLAEVHPFPGTKPNTGTSVEPRSRFQGKGNGKGKGFRGGGAGEGSNARIDASESRFAGWLAWATQHLPDLPAEFVAQTCVAMDGSFTPDEIRAAVLRSYPSLMDGAS